MSFTENDIRPAEYDSGRARALGLDLAWLSARRGSFVEVGCPACAGRCQRKEFNKYSFDFVKCTDCGTVYMSPRADADTLEAFYKRSALYEYWNTYIFPASREVRRAEIFRPRVSRLLDLCARYGTAKSVLIEAGAGHGLFCEEIDRTGAFDRVIAIEPNHSLAETCRGLGIETIEDTVENAAGSLPSADVLASFETIEHLFAPEEFLRACRRLLAPDGLVVVTCPNYEGFDIQTLGPASDSLDAEHINMFNPRSLSALFERCGLDVLECTTPGELDAGLVRAKTLAGACDLTGQPFLQKILLERWEECGKPFQEFLRVNRLSSHMWLAAQLVP